MSHPYLEPSTYARLHRQAFELCVKDLDTALEYVEAHNQNLDIFSHRFYELLLRSCTEFESLAKTLLSAHGTDLKDNASIKDYFPLAGMYRLADCHVFATRWNPVPLGISPFADWTSPTEGPSWYRAYNRVKHSRRANFGNASLRNVLNAVSAVMILLVQAYRPYFLGSRPLALTYMASSRWFFPISRSWFSGCARTEPGTVAKSGPLPSED